MSTLKPARDTSSSLTGALAKTREIIRQSLHCRRRFAMICKSAAVHHTYSALLGDGQVWPLLRLTYLPSLFALRVWRGPCSAVQRHHESTRQVRRSPRSSSLQGACESHS